MRCSEFEQRLTAFLSGDLSAREREDAITHLEDCPDCRQTTQIARGDFDLEPEKLPEDLVSEVLAVTSGATCRHALRQLCELADGTVNPKYARVVAGHLRTCVECSRLFVALTELSEVLPEMALLEPDASFTADVLSKTTNAREVCSPPNRIQRFLQSIFQRPRFSWEAAYVGTLLIMTVWGGFASPGALEKSSQKLASTQINLNRLADDLQQIPAKNWIMNRTEELNQEITDRYVVWKRSAIDSIMAARQQIQEFPEKSGEYLEIKMGRTLEAISSQLQRISGKPGSNSDTTLEPPKG